MKKDSKHYDLLIVGGGVSGIYGLYYANLYGLKSLLIESNSYLGGLLRSVYPDKYIYNFPTYNKIKAIDLVKKLVTQIETNKCKYWLNTTLTNLKKSGKDYEILLNKNQKITAKNIIFATGLGQTVIKKLPGKNYDNVIYKPHSNWNLYTNKQVIILGSGETAIEQALSIINNSHPASLTIICRGSSFSYASPLSTKLAKNKKIKVYFEKNIKNYTREKITIVDIKTNKTIRLPFDYLLVFYGTEIIPNKQLLKLFKHTPNNKYIVDAKMQTGKKNIYAVGAAREFIFKKQGIIVSISDMIIALYDILIKANIYKFH